MAARPLIRLVSVAHSYCVALNRRLAQELAREGSGRWEVTAVAPSFFHGDMRPIPLERAPDEPCALEPVPAHLSNRIHVMLYGRRLREVLRSPWDVVHCWEEPYIAAGGQVARWSRPDARLVYATFQNNPKHYPPPFGWIERYAIRRSSGWIAFGETIRAALEARPGYAERPHRVIPLGVDTSAFRPDPAARQRALAALGWDPAGPPVVGFLGRFVPEKGTDLLRRTLERLESPWRALFVGGGPLEGDLRSWAARQGGRAIVVTGVPHDRVPEHLNAMDMLCAPSQTTPAWREQLGRMLIEAFACGVPVVASDSGEIPYVVADAGIVVGERDEPGWARAVGELLESPARRHDLAARGLERAHAEYAWSVIARRHLEFFGALLDVRRGAA